MVIDSISPTFSIPAAAQYFEISTDNGITYTDANIIEMNYYALNKMEDFTGDNNSMNLLFRKKSNITDEQDYRVTKILVNEASTFLPSPNTGLNVVSTSTQKAQGNYFAGRYATYNSVTTGGLNFSDFKIQSIQDSSMQMVFFINPVGGLDIIIKSQSKTYGGCTLKVGFNSAITTTSLNKTIKTGQNLTFSTWASFSFPSNTEPINYYFEYGVTKSDVIGNTQLPVNPTQTGEYNWNINIEEIIWTADPEIIVAPVSFNAEWYKIEDYGSIELPQTYYSYNENGEYVGNPYSGTQYYTEYRNNMYHIRNTSDWIQDYGVTDNGPVKTHKSTSWSIE